MLPLGTSAPAFTLPSVSDGRLISLSDFQGQKGILVMFICAHCPYVKHINEELARLGNTYPEKGVAMVAIGSNNAVKYPADAPEKLKEQAETFGFRFPYLYDADQSVAKAYTAACTPDFFLFDAEFQLVYRGQLDGSRPGSGDAVTGTDLRAAMDAVVAGTPIPEPQIPSMGCNIKWIPGQEPAYFG